MLLPGIAQCFPNEWKETGLYSCTQPTSRDRNGPNKQRCSQNVPQTQIDDLFLSACHLASYLSKSGQRFWGFPLSSWLRLKPVSDEKHQLRECESVTVLRWHEEGWSSPHKVSSVFENVVLLTFTDAHSRGRQTLRQPPRTCEAKPARSIVRNNLEEL